MSIVAAALLAAGETHARAQTYRERGAYLVNAVAVCGNCHTPRDAAGKPIDGKELSGGREFDIAAGHIVGSNITPDRETGVGTWSLGQIVYALRNGKRPDGSTIGPPMPCACSPPWSSERHAFSTRDTCWDSPTSRTTIPS